MGRRSELKLFTQAIANEWPMPQETKERIIQTMLDIVEGRVKASAREKIRATECLAKLDALNIQREAIEKTKRMELQVLTPAYQQMTSEANEQMVEYLQQVSITDDDSA